LDLIIGYRLVLKISNHTGACFEVCGTHGFNPSGSSGDAPLDLPHGSSWEIQHQPIWTPEYGRHDLARVALRFDDKLFLGVRDLDFRNYTRAIRLRSAGRYK